MIEVSVVRYVTIKKAAEVTGYTEDAIRKKISLGIWPENLVWKWGPDSVQLVDLEGYDKWAKQVGKASQRGKHLSSLTSGTRGSDTSNP